MEKKLVQNMPVNRLTCKPQIRESFDEESLTGLAQSIKESGILQPILVRREGSDFIVVEGERRLRAAQMAGLAEVPVIIDDRELSEGEVLHRQLVTNCQREELSPIEKSRAIDRLMKGTGWNAAQVAVKLGISPGMVSKLLALLTLPEQVQDRLSDGSLGLSAAYEISQVSDTENQRVLAREAAAGRLTREAIAAQTKSQKRPRSSNRKNSGNARQQIVISLGGGRSIVATGPDLTLEVLVAELETAIGRIRQLSAQGMDLADAVKFIAERNEEAA
jgi:ParB family chromosome partitioning protein